jgi:5'-nucleotidase
MTRSPQRVAALATAVAALAIGPLAAPAQAAPVQIDLLTINDFHGRIETDGAVGGAAVLAGAVNQFRAENPNTVFVSAGDLIGASTFTSFIQDDNPTIDAMNAAGLQVSAVGNHEYDQGWSDLRDDVIGGADGHAAQWPYLAANVLLDETDEPAVETPPYWVVETGGVRVGFIGTVTEDLPSLVSPEGMEGLLVTSIVETTNAYAAGLSDGDESNGEADVVVALVHEDVEGTIAETLSDDVDVIFGGHTHEQYAYGPPDAERPVLQTGQYGENVGHVRMTVDPDTDEISFDVVENLPLMTCGEDECTPNYEPDPEVQDIVDEAVEVAEELGAQPLGTVTENITRAFDVVFDDSTGQRRLAEDRGEESTLGNLVADAQRWATTDLPTGEAQIAFMNPGGLRADLCYAEADYPYEENPEAPDADVVCAGVPDDGGVITYRDAATVQPFANTLVRMSLTGAQVESVLQEQLQPAGSSRPFLHLGVSEGFTYTYEMTTDDAGVPTAFEVVDMWLHGEPIDPARSYEVVANSFLAAGGDNFTTFAKAVDAQDTGQIDLETFVEFMAAHSAVAPDLQERAIDLASVGEARIEWPEALGNPPSMRAGTDRRFSLVTDLPVALPEEFAFTVEAPDGFSVEMDEPMTADAFEELLDGLPAGEQSLPFRLAIDEDVTEGDYELVFTLDRTGPTSVFDGNPLQTPLALTVDLHVSSHDQNTGGGVGTGVSSATAGASPLVAVAAGIALLAATGLGLLAARRRREGLA